jgi:hypothetical protein
MDELRQVFLDKEIETMKQDIKTMKRDIINKDKQPEQEKK